MKIALFHNTVPGGAHRVVMEYSRGLLAKGHSLTCYVPEEYEDLHEPLKRLGARIAACRLPGHFNPGKRFPYLFQAWYEFVAFVWRCFQYRKACRHLARKIDREGYDLVWIEKCRFLSSSSVIRYLKTRTVYYCQEPWRDGYERHHSPQENTAEIPWKVRLMRRSKSPSSISSPAGCPKRPCGKRSAGKFGLQPEIHTGCLRYAVKGLLPWRRSSLFPAPANEKVKLCAFRRTAGKA